MVINILCVCVYLPPFHPCPHWRFTQSSLLQISSPHGAPPPQFAHHGHPASCHSHAQRQTGVLSQRHQHAQQLVSSKAAHMYTQTHAHNVSNTGPIFNSTCYQCQHSSPFLKTSISIQQETSGPEKRGWKEEAAHKEASERIHVVHEGDEGQSSGRMHAERERSYQSNPGPKGEGASTCTHEHSSLNSLRIKNSVS